MTFIMPRNDCSHCTSERGNFCFLGFSLVQASCLLAEYGAIEYDVGTFYLKQDHCCWPPASS